MTSDLMGGGGGGVLGQMWVGIFGKRVEWDQNIEQILKKEVTKWKL